MNKLLLNIGLKYGVIGFLLYAIVYIVAWKVDLSLFLNPLVSYPTALLIFVLGVLAQLEARKKLGGYIEFGHALLVFVIVLAIALLGALIVNYLIFNVFDPAAKEQLLELTIQESLAMMDKMGEMFGIQEQMGEAMNEDILREAMEQQNIMGLGTLIFTYISNLVMFTIGGLISAAIIKRKAPIQFD
ncbi:MAG: DUF4199 domain-containing protein [Nonlabens sp.]|uniref:DUF4199 domain-containing protein n=1 Tax=Nonlabens sp. TaxID=1888209 RepID=UPI003EF771B5